MTDIQDFSDLLGDIPDDKPKKKTPRERAKKTKHNPATSFLTALKFVSLAQTKNGETNATHCSITNNWLCTTLGAITVGTYVQEPIACCPHTGQLVEALKSVETEMSVTQIETHSLSIVSGDMRAIVECQPISAIEIPAPDAPVAEVNDRVVQALWEASKAVNEKGQLKYQSIYFGPNIAYATKGEILIEAYHGFDMPHLFRLPVKIASVLRRSGKKLERFGYSEQSVTFWFEDGSFIRSQIFEPGKIEYDHLMLKDYSDLVEVPTNFFNAMIKVGTFSQPPYVYFKQGEIVASYFDEITTSFKFSELPEGVGFDSSLIKLIKDWATHICIKKIDRNGFIMHVYGEQTRAVIASLEAPQQNTFKEHETSEEYNARMKEWADNGYNDNDIPF